MQCPACGYMPAPGEGDGTQCPDCQVFYHKVLARQLRELQRKKGEEVPANPPPAAQSIAPLKVARNIAGGTIRALLSLIVISLVVVACINGNSRNDTETAAKKDHCDDAHMAQIMSRHFVKPRLASPSTAKFPSYHDSGVSVTTHGDCTFTVRSYVDAQNAFGAMIRNRYTARMEYLKDSKKWRGTSIEMH